MVSSHIDATYPTSMCPHAQHEYNNNEDKNCINVNIQTNQHYLNVLKTFKIKNGVRIFNIHRYKQTLHDCLVRSNL